MPLKNTCIWSLESLTSVPHKFASDDVSIAAPQVGSEEIPLLATSVTIETLERVWNEQKSKIRAVVFRILRTSEGLDDCCQEILLKAWLKLGTFRKESQLKTWLYRIAANHAIDTRRSRRTGKNRLVFSVGLLNELGGERYGRK